MGGRIFTLDIGAPLPVLYKPGGWGKSVTILAVYNDIHIALLVFDVQENWRVKEDISTLHINDLLDLSTSVHCTADWLHLNIESYTSGSRVTNTTAYYHTSWLHMPQNTLRLCQHVYEIGVCRANQANSG